MIVTLDFETFYTQEYSLRKMSEVDYILSPLFETIMCAVKINDAPSRAYVGQAAVARALNAIDWSRAAMLSHNIRFDGAIAAWHYHIRPKLYLCTLSMARALTHIAAGGSSLDKVSKYLGLPPKGDAVVRAMGKRLADFGADLPAYMAYCLRDNENCYAIFRRFQPVFPKSELHVVDMTARMFIEPEVQLDRQVLTDHLTQVRIDRAALFAKVAHIPKDVFSSSSKFATLLRGLGVEVPMKPSPSILGIEIPALAKADRGFKELCEDPDQPDYVQALLAARIGAKSTLEETRTVTLLNLSQRQWGNTFGWCPIPLKYYGAHTGRLSGDGGFNFLNLKRGSPLRRAIVAPPGMRIVHRDSSQIEARMVAWLAGCWKLLIAFAEGRDVYCEFASKVYGRTITKADKLERFAGGKTPILGLGYGMGPPRFQHTLFIGNGGMSVSVDIKEAARVVYLYRSEYPEIPDLWGRGNTTLRHMIQLGAPHYLGANMAFRRTNMPPLFSGWNIPAVSWSAEAIWLPNGMAIQYPGLQQRPVPQPDGTTTNEISYDGGHRGRVKLFGGKVIENISQALARIVITDIATRVYHQTGFKPFLNTYDSLDVCVPEADAPAMDAYLERQFAIRPSWAPELPLASEGGWGLNMMDAEHGVNQ